MKNKFLYGMVILLLAAMSVSTVQATNDYLEQKEHYTVMNMGNGVYRFYVPIWVYGRINNYYLDASKDHNDANDSYIWYSLKKDQARGSEDVHRIATVAAVRAGKNVDENYRGKGEGYIYVHEGSVVVQNKMPNGQSLYFLTIQSAKAGELQFQTEDGTPLSIENLPIVNYEPDSHHGSLYAPVLLRPGNPDRVRKIIENDHVIIIRNNEKYDVTGKKTR